MKNILCKTKLAFFSLLLFSAAAVFALPGFESPLADSSGDFVYYRDSSFKRESIIGFITFDEGTYGARYYSPADKKAKLTEKDITVYLSINPEGENLEITGEKIVGAATAEDTDIVNYIHSLFYTFVSARKKVSFEDMSLLKSTENLSEFGGEVVLEYDPFVPLFNIRSLSSAGKEILSVETAGRVLSSSDDTFSSYRGIKKLPQDKKRKIKKSNKDPLPVNYGKQKVTLDEAWTQSMENLWVLGDVAVLTMMSGDSIDKDSYFRALKSSLMGHTHSYPLWKHSKSEWENSADNLLAKSCVLWYSEGDGVTRVFKTLFREEDGIAHIFSLTVFEGAYQKNRAYFEKILHSWTLTLQ